MPEPGKNLLYFKNIHFQHPVPYTIYADFESILVPLDSAEPSSLGPYTEKMATHEPCGYAYVVVGPDGKATKPMTIYRGPDAATHFMRQMLQEKDTLAPRLLNVAPMRLTLQDELQFRAATHCAVCLKTLGEDRVRDHDHLTGLYRNALHRQCNLQFRMRKMIPVVFHNLKNYDAHHIVKTLGEFKDHRYEVIANNMEKYITFSVVKKEAMGVSVSLQFLDSLQFLPASLQSLVGNLEPTQFKILNSNMPADKVPLLLRKGVYPYEYMDSFIKFDETSLPPKEAFFSSLSGEDISSEDYAHAQKVWAAFNIQSLGEYHDLYVGSDVLQLADVFENFRALCQKNYEIDPAHLLTAPGLAWQACLKMCRQPLELLTDIDMLLFVERGIRGGISTITKRHALANNKYMAHYDPQSPSKYIMYLDANNLYGWAMSQALPYGGFEWAPADQVSTDWIMSIPQDSEEGYIFEVDLEYPEELHDLHNDYPLAPERITIKEEMLSPTALDILKTLNNQKFKECEKLVPNLQDKKNYVTYHRNLQLYLSLGLKLTKVHKVLKFLQRPWLKPYIEFNTEKRKESATTFEKDFFKLLNNSVYGKTMENMRNRVDIQLVHTERRAKKLIAAPSFRAFKIFSEELTGVERVKTSITMNRPLYVGFVILELSKVLMYEFHYNHMKQLYGERAQLLFTDTDSLTYEIESEDLYKDMSQHPSMYDFSDYPRHHPLYSDANKKKIGCFKDELASKPAVEFVGLRAKMYSIITEDQEKKTAKGVSRAAIKHRLKHADYRQCLQGVTSTREKMTRIGSESHQLYTLCQNKTALSPFDDKRFIREDGVCTYAYGHANIQQVHTSDLDILIQVMEEEDNI